MLLYKLKTNAYKFSWALIPISVPFVWLLFPFSRRFRLYDHTVFVTYSLCFMMLLLMAGTLVGLVSPSIASLAWFFIPPIHMYRQLRGAYSLTRWGSGLARHPSDDLLLRRGDVFLRGADRHGALRLAAAGVLFLKDTEHGGLQAHALSLCSP